MSRRANRKSIRRILPLSGKFAPESKRDEGDYHVSAVSDSPQNDGEEDAWRIAIAIVEDDKRIEYVGNIYADEDKDADAMRELRGGNVVELDISEDEEDGLIYVTAL